MKGDFGRMADTQRWGSSYGLGMYIAVPALRGGAVCIVGGL